MLLLPAFTGAPARNKVYHTDLFTLCDAMPSQSVDMVLMDLPYGTTACHWDSVIPFEPMWARLKRIIKPRRAIVLTASQPFTSALLMSNPAWLQDDWIWNKSLPTGHLNANIKPLRKHEEVLIFAERTPDYFPQLHARIPHGKTKNGSPAGVYREFNAGVRRIDLFEGYPTSVLNFNTCYHAGEAGLHPTQKPVALFEYLIRTYTQEGELVFDGVVGSGTTAVAARNCKREVICGDKELDYVLTARDRLRLPFEKKQKPAENDVTDLPLFAAVSE